MSLGIAFGMLLLLLPLQTVFAQDGDGGTESNLSILGYGARAIGMGKAFTALADDPTAVYWNPAGLEFLYQQSVTLFHTTLWEGTNYEFLGYAYPTLNLGSFGFGIARIGVSDIPQTDVDGLEVGRFSNEEYQVFLSYAKKMPFNLTPGISIRMVSRSWGGLRAEEDLNDTGFGIDLGLLYRPVWLGSPWFQDWSFGLKIANFLKPQLKEGDIIDDIPMLIKLGFMKKIRFAGGEFFNVLLDFDFSTQRTMKAHLGSGYRIRDIAEVRIGFGGAGFAMGAGVDYENFKIDYAYSFGGEYSEFLPGVHRISLSYQFGTNRDQMFQIEESRRLEEQARLLEEFRREEDKRFVSEHLRTADSYFKSGKFFDAVVEYQAVISRDSSHTYAQTMADSANAILQRGFDEAQALALQDALDKRRAENDKIFVEQHFGKGMTFLDQNQFNEALIEFNIALERDSENTMLVNAIQTTRRRIVEEAQRLVDRSREELDNQNYSESLVLLADARSLAANNPRIIRQIDEITTQVGIQRNIQKGLLLFQINEYQKALEVFNEILVIDPENELILDYQRRAKIETISKDVKMDQGTEKLYLDGMNQFLKGNYAGAILIWEEILVEQPYNKKVLKAVEGAREKMQQGSE
jgi:tetratricopeptide (TPR) repeat protein